MTDRKYVAMTARMDGQRLIASKIGCKVKVSEMELVTLCNFAKLGMYSVLSSRDGGCDPRVAVNMDKLTNAIRCVFGNDENPDGLNVLTSLCAAIIYGERLGKYVLSGEE